MKESINNFLETIQNIRTIELANAVGVSRNMAEKYKKFSSYPPLDKAVIIEDKFGIPPRIWVDIRKSKELEEKK
jgi:predicted transcriptional regulator